MNSSIHPSVWPSVRPPIRPSICLSICQSRYLLLNHWAALYQTCYITSSHGKGVRDQQYFFLCRQFVVSPFIRHSLFLNQGAEFNQTCYVTFPHSKDVQEQHYFSMHPSVCLSITLSSLTTGWNSAKLTALLPLIVRVCKNNIIFLCVCCLSICLLCCLLRSHWAEFNQTCYITSPHGKAV